MEHKDVELQTPTVEETKAQWQTPEVIRLEAGAAELGDTVAGEGALLS